MAKEGFFKFPRTTHAFDAGGNSVSRDDLVMNDKELLHFLRGKHFVVEEKVDGANLGISITKEFKIVTQNRAHFVDNSTHRQFSGLVAWLEKHSEDMHRILEPERHILFGEWLQTKHSIHYDALPDYFLAFDIYDKHKNVFFSVKERDETLLQTRISTVRTIENDCTSLNKSKLLNMLETKSQYYDGWVEGLVLKQLDATESNRAVFFTTRAKLVRPDFMQGIQEQWTRQKLVKNRLLCYD